jgi:hypothetical protein
VSDGDPSPLHDERDAPVPAGELEELRHRGRILLDVEVLDLEAPRAVLDPSGVRVLSGVFPVDLHGFGHGHLLGPRIAGEASTATRFS